MIIDDPESYATDRFDVLYRVEDQLGLFDSGDTAPIAVGDGPQAQAWLVARRNYDQLGRALAWWRSNRARDDHPDDADARKAYDTATDRMLRLDQPSPVLDDLRVLTPAEFGSALPELVGAIRTGTPTAPVAVGRHGTPEAVLVPHPAYRELVEAHLRWRSSDELMASLDPDAHKPLTKSQPVDLDEFFRSLGPKSAQMWDDVKREKGSDQDTGG